ncbi:hypothetical protein [Nocardiopsis flavescens]
MQLKVDYECGFLLDFRMLFGGLLLVAFAGLFLVLAWAFFVKYDKIQGFFLRGVPDFFRADEYRASFSYKVTRYFTVAMFIFFALCCGIYGLAGIFGQVSG